MAKSKKNGKTKNNNSHKINKRKKKVKNDINEEDNSIQNSYNTNSYNQMGGENEIDPANVESIDVEIISFKGIPGHDESLEYKAANLIGQGDTIPDEEKFSSDVIIELSMFGRDFIYDEDETRDKKRYEKVFLTGPRYFTFENNNSGNDDILNINIYDGDNMVSGEGMPSRRKLLICNKNYPLRDIGYGNNPYEFERILALDVSEELRTKHEAVQDEAKRAKALKEIKIDESNDPPEIELKFNITYKNPPPVSPQQSIKSLASGPPLSKTVLSQEDKHPKKRVVDVRREAELNERREAHGQRQEAFEVKKAAVERAAAAAKEAAENAAEKKATAEEKALVAKKAREKAREEARVAAERAARVARGAAPASVKRGERQLVKAAGLAEAESPKNPPATLTRQNSAPLSDSLSSANKEYPGRTTRQINRSPKDKATLALKQPAAPVMTEPDSDPHLDPDSDPHLDPDSDPHLDPHSDPHLDPDLDPNLDPDLDPSPSLHPSPGPEPEPEAEAEGAAEGDGEEKARKEATLQDNLSRDTLVQYKIKHLIVNDPIIFYTSQSNVKYFHDVTLEIMKQIGIKKVKELLKNSKYNISEINEDNNLNLAFNKITIANYIFTDDNLIEKYKKRYDKSKDEILFPSDKNANKGEIISINPMNTNDTNDTIDVEIKQDVKKGEMIDIKDYILKKDIVTKTKEKAKKAAVTKAKALVVNAAKKEAKNPTTENVPGAGAALKNTVNNSMSGGGGYFSNFPNLFKSKQNSNLNINSKSSQVRSNITKKVLQENLNINIKYNDFLNVTDVDGGVLIEMNITNEKLNEENHAGKFESVIEEKYGIPIPTHTNLITLPSNNNLINIKKEYDIQQRMMTSICVDQLSKGKNTPEKKPITKMFLEIDKILESDNNLPFASKIEKLNDLLKSKFGINNNHLIFLDEKTLNFRYPDNIHNDILEINPDYRKNTIEKIKKLTSGLRKDEVFKKKFKDVLEEINNETNEADNEVEDNIGNDKKQDQ